MALKLSQIGGKAGFLQLLAIEVNQIDRAKITMMENLTCEQFAQYLGSAFYLHVRSQAPMELKLVEATPYQAHFASQDRESEKRSPFSLVFQGSLEMHLPQQIYTLAHPEMGQLDIFLVPIARRQDGMYYEAVFT